MFLTTGPIDAANLEFPALSGRVVDQANILPASSETVLNDWFAAHEAGSTDQIVVVTVTSLQGVTIEDFGYQLGRHWGIGQKGKDNGVLLIVAPKERKVRIEVGYGLEGRMTDALARSIIEKDILPAFRENDLPGGIMAGALSILDALGNATVEADRETRDSKRARSDDEFWAYLMLIFGAVMSVVISIWSRGWTDYDKLSREFDIERHRDHIWGGGGGYFGGSAGGFSGGGGGFGGGGASGGW
ncbi:MAG: TPM domain-containing protein [Rhodospirillales bacterium]